MMVIIPSSPSLPLAMLAEAPWKIFPFARAFENEEEQKMRRINLNPDTLSRLLALAYYLHLQRFLSPPRVISSVRIQFNSSNIFTSIDKRRTWCAWLDSDEPFSFAPDCIVRKLSLRWWPVGKVLNVFIAVSKFHHALDYSRHDMSTKRARDSTNLREFKGNSVNMKIQSENFSIKLLFAAIFRRARWVEVQVSAYMNAEFDN